MAVGMLDSGAAFGDLRVVSPGLTRSITERHPDEDARAQNGAIVGDFLGSLTGCGVEESVGLLQCGVAAAAERLCAAGSKGGDATVVMASMGGCDTPFSVFFQPGGCAACAAHIS